ncbi:unnamed protein product [Acanthocheilonema viteae]|uniref:Cytochrome b561 domain-containing protein n=1 Tax=Acanthocheilonema viteae TaxID=6277 RepID=A0A498SNN8_ACAVI|nr:unnamed protein product [Acanthocheilonema viteae]
MSLLHESFKVLNDHQSIRLFNIIVGASQVFGISAIFLVAIWMANFNGGFTSGLQFHYHPTFMVMGMIFLAGDGMLVYRVFRHERKRFSKLLHLTLHTMVLIFTVVALKAVFDSHNNHKNDEGEPDPLPNMFSLHSWVGLTSVIAFFFQYLFGFTTFFFPGLSIPIRQFTLPYHQTFGLIILCFLAITAVMGISEQAAWHHNHDEIYIHDGDDDDDCCREYHHIYDDDHREYYHIYDDDHREYHHIYDGDYDDDDDSHRHVPNSIAMAHANSTNQKLPNSLSLPKIVSRMKWKFCSLDSLLPILQY